MATVQLPPLQFEEGGLQIVLLPSLEEEVTGTFEDPFADYFSAQENNNKDSVENDKPLLTTQYYIEPKQQVLPEKPKQKLPEIPKHELDHQDKQEHSQESQQAPKQETRQEPRQAPKQEARQEPWQAPKKETRQEPLQELNQEPRQPSPQEFEQDNQAERDDFDSPSAADESGPQHPIPAFQDAFAESLREATEGTAIQKPNLQGWDAKARREMLLSQDKDDEPFDVKWRYRPGQTQHEVMKLVAQISFGVYLMFNGMANSNSQVIGILQGHIDEIDEFLEVALEDLNQAVEDLSKRIQHLELPMENMLVFEQLLKDSKFRAEILDGNERIDAILTRTNVAMRQWDDDIEAGLRSSTVFGGWLNDNVNGPWREDQPDLLDVYDAMKGNTDGWLNAFQDMNDRAQEINGLIMTLMTIITEMETKASEVTERASISPTPAGTSIHQSTHKTVKGASPSPPPSRHSHVKSLSPSVGTQIYAPNPLSLTPNESNKDDEEDDDDIFFPLPGGLPLLPPTPNRHRNSTSVSSRLTESPTVQLTYVSSDASLSNAASEDTSLYILQPRTYTPQLPPPVPSPRLRNSESPVISAPLIKKPSLRDRIVNPPTSIQIPPTADEESPLFPPGLNFPTPRSTNSMHDLRHSRQPQRPRAASPLDTPSSDMRTFTPSPFSDQHALQPVRASPHSPLQQRPHTAAPGPQRPGSGQTTRRPTQLGAMTNMTNLSSVTVAQSIDDRGSMTSAMSHTPSGRQVKKKKSAFGWFKKAFTMDEDERAAFEARKAAAAQGNNHYYNQQDSPRFLDGRRIR